jgi:hypothetical protein
VPWLYDGERLKKIHSRMEPQLPPKMPQIMRVVVCRYELWSSAIDISCSRAAIGTPPIHHSERPLGDTGP